MTFRSIASSARSHARLLAWRMKVAPLPRRGPWMRSFASSTDAGGNPQESPSDLPTWNRYVKLGTAFLAVMLGLQIGPYMGQNTVNQAVILMNSKDPFFQRSGAWRLRQAMVTDALRAKAIEAGSLPRLLALLGDDNEIGVRREASLALAAIAEDGAAALALVELGAIPLLQRHLLPESTLEPDSRHALEKALRQLQAAMPR